MTLCKPRPTDRLLEERREARSCVRVSDLDVASQRDVARRTSSTREPDVALGSRGALVQSSCSAPRAPSPADPEARDGAGTGTGLANRHPSRRDGTRFRPSLVD